MPANHPSVPDLIPSVISASATASEYARALGLKVVNWPKYTTEQLKQRSELFGIASQATENIVDQFKYLSQHFQFPLASPRLGN